MCPLHTYWLFRTDSFIVPSISHPEITAWHEHVPEASLNRNMVDFFKMNSCEALWTLCFGETSPENGVGRRVFFYPAQCVNGSLRRMICLCEISSERKLSRLKNWLRFNSFRCLGSLLQLGEIAKPETKIWWKTRFWSLFSPSRLYHVRLSALLG